MTATDYFGAGSVDYLTALWSRGEAFNSLLSENRDFLMTIQSPEEVFTPMVLADLFLLPPRPPWLRSILTAHRPLIDRGQPIHFFRREDLLPADVDCTAVGFSLAARALMLAPEALARIAEQVAGNVSSNGVVQVYFDPGGERDGLVDRVVCVNALYLLNLAGRQDLALATEAYVCDELRSERYLGGSRYYPSPDTFLYFLSRLVAAFPVRYMGISPRLIAAIRARQGLESRPLELAQRVLAATRLGLGASLDAWLLRSSKMVDASFPADALFQYGRSRRYFGGTAITTAFAARALIEYGRALRFASRHSPSAARLPLRRPRPAS